MVFLRCCLDETRYRNNRNSLGVPFANSQLCFLGISAGCHRKYSWKGLLTSIPGPGSTCVCLSHFAFFGDNFCVRDVYYKIYHNNKTRNVYRCVVSLVLCSP